MAPMMQGPVVTELGRRWVTGQVSSDEYFDRIWRDALTRAAGRVRARLQRQTAPSGRGRGARRIG
ncbi:MAG: hypothetical protein M3N17_10105 [Actinomycetota bacterium]|nr:hypothetical protein [Actinomycetota bacterium]